MVSMIGFFSFVFLRYIQFYFFFFNDTATTEIYTLSLHDALPIWSRPLRRRPNPRRSQQVQACRHRSEEHTSELQSQSNLVCRLLLEKKKKRRNNSLVPNTVQNISSDITT